jgi:hypothetical protein
MFTAGSACRAGIAEHPVEGDLVDANRIDCRGRRDDPTLIALPDVIRLPWEPYYIEPPD